MTKRHFILTITGLTLAACPQLRASEMSKSDRLRTLDNALAAFDHGAAAASPKKAAEQYREAAGGFEKLAAASVENGPLYYNLGNTYLRLGDVGRAIANYRRALRYTPDDANLIANLRFARSHVQTPIEASGENKLLHGVFFWHFGTSIRGRMIFTIVCFIAGWVALMIRLVAPSAWLRNIAIALILVAAASGISATVSKIEATRHPEGVLVAGETVIRKGNGTTYEPVFEKPLSAGVEFTILETRTDATGRSWDRVEFPNGAQGWLPADAAAPI